MRRWIGRLHGGQLIMLFLGLLAASAPLAWLGNLYVVSANADFKGASDARFGSDYSGFRPDTVAAGILQRKAMTEVSISERWYLGMFAIWLFCIFALWIWLGTRRRNIVVAEVIHD